MRANIQDPTYLAPCEYRCPDVSLHRIFTCGDDLAVSDGLRAGDVAYCEHGYIWLVVSAPRFWWVATAKRLSPLLNPIKYRKAVNALAHSDTPKIPSGQAAENAKIRRKVMFQSYDEDED